MNFKILICQDRRNRLKCRGAPWPQILSEIWAEIMEARTLLLRDNFHFCASHYPSSGPPDFQTCLWPSYARRGAYSFKSTAKHRQLTQYSSHRGVGVSRNMVEPIPMRWIQSNPADWNKVNNPVKKYWGPFPMSRGAGTKRDLGEFSPSSFEGFSSTSSFFNFDLK